MGASQSSTGGDRSAGQEVKTSYYELLGIDRTATDEEIKKAYKKAALRLHPDRNFGNEEVATKTFAEVSAAYEILSDPQERAWYDSHECAILRGDDATDGAAPTYENVRVTTADDLARLVRKFNKNVDFSDAPSGFFGFLRETFDQLAKEEEIAAGMDGGEARDYPSFGHKDDQYDDVVKQFYTTWSSFSTIKSFSWKDQYRLSEAPDRWYRRRMESENNRLRADAKREFNEAVRSLIAFVKKRDPRYVPNSQTEAERQQALREATAAQAARARAANEAKMSASVPEWTKVREPEDEDFEESEEEIEEQVLECVACDKIFKSERQWEAHEKSKKHQKAVRALKKKMQKDEKNLELDHGAKLDADDDGRSEPDSDAEFEILDHDEAIADGEPEVIDEDELSADAVGSTQDENEVDVNTEPAPKDSNREPDKVDLKSDPATSPEISSPNSEDDDYAPIETIQARMKLAALSTSQLDSDEDSTTQKQPSKPKMGKAAQKRAKKAAAAAAAAPEQREETLICEVCKAGFPSKNKLFDHIKEEGHAALKADGKAKGKKKKGGR